MSGDLEWVRSAGRGTVYTFSVVHTRFFDQPWELPYVVAVVQLEEGVRLLSNIIQCRPEEVVVGMPVEVTFEDVTEEISLPKFRPLEVLGDGHRE
jgi:hypothetical protein